MKTAEDELEQKEEVIQSLRAKLSVIEDSSREAMKAQAVEHQKEMMLMEIKFKGLLGALRVDHSQQLKKHKYLKKV